MEEKKNITKRKKKRVLHFYANDNNFSKVNVNIPEEYKNKIVCGDSLEVLKKLPDNCIDLVLTSPPYNFGKSYNEYDDNSTNSEYFEKLFEILSETARVVKYGGRIIINIMPLYSDFIPTHHIITNWFIQQKWIWRDEIIWEKNQRNCAYSCWGSYRSSSSPFMKHTYEFIEVYAKGDIKHEISNHKEQDDMQKLEFAEWVKNGTWSLPGEAKMKEFGHPAMFPEGLAYRAIKLFSGRGDVVMDIFNGCGTTTKVAKENGRVFLGIDIDQKYCETAQTRVDKTQVKDFVLMNEI